MADRLLAPVPIPRPTFRIRELLHALIFASVICGAMLVARSAYAEKTRFTGLFGNLLLAWIPLVLAIVAERLRTLAAPPRQWIWFCRVLWLLFFPNALYIVTDLIHIKKHGMDGVPRWFDHFLIMGHAAVGIFLGCLSLHLMELAVRERWGRRAGLGFAAGVLALGAFGIYLGRFVRLNSWDVVVRPFKLVTDVAALAHPTKAGEVAAYSATFFFFSLAMYALVVATARLQLPTDKTEHSSAGQ